MYTPRSRYAFVIFDLDGTLVDPGDAISATITATLATFGLTEESKAHLRSCIGPPLHEIYGSFGLAGELLQTAIAALRAIFAQFAEQQYRPYCGVPELLEALRTAGVRVAIATSKVTEQAQRLVELLDLGAFTAICGERPDDLTTGKADTVCAARSAAADIPPAATVVVGDRCFDLDAAACCGVDAIAAGYGFGSAAELSASPHRFFAHTVAELRSFLLA